MISVIHLLRIPSYLWPFSRYLNRCTVFNSTLAMLIQYSAFAIPTTIRNLLSIHMMLNIFGFFSMRFLWISTVEFHTQYENNINFTPGFFADQQITELVQLLGRMFLQQNKKAGADRWQVNHLKQYFPVESYSGKQIKASLQLLENKEGKQLILFRQLQLQSLSWLTLS